MMKSIHIFLVLMSFYFFSPVVDAQKYTLDISGKPILLDYCDYKIEEIIDARHDKSNIGFIPKGNVGTKYLLDFKYGFINQLTEYFTQNIQPADGHIPLIVSVNHLMVYNDAIEKSAINIAEVNLDFYVKGELGWYHEFQAANYTIAKGAGTEKKYEKLIRELLLKSFHEFISRMCKDLGYHKLVTEREMYDNSTMIFNQPDKLYDNRVQGIYYSYNDFRDNICDNQSVFTTREKHDDESGRTYLNLHFENKFISEKDVYALYYKSEIFINLDRQFIPIDYINDTLFIPFLPENWRDSDLARIARIGAGIYWMGILGGLAVAAIELNKSEVDFANQFIVDPVTGMMISKNQPDYKSPGGEIVLFTDLLKDGDQLFEVYINDVYQCTLNSQSFTKICGLKHFEDISIKIVSGDSEFSDVFALDKANTLYVEIIRKKRSNLVLFRWKSETSIECIESKINKGYYYQIHQEN